MKKQKGKMLKTGDQVRYISDVYTEYQGQVMTATEFDIQHRLMGLRGEDGGEIVAFWDEIEVV